MNWLFLREKSVSISVFHRKRPQSEGPAFAHHYGLLRHPAADKEDAQDHSWKGKKCYRLAETDILVSFSSFPHSFPSFPQQVSTHCLPYSRRIPHSVGKTEDVNGLASD